MPFGASLQAVSQCEVCRRWAGGALCDDCVVRWACPVPRCQGCALRLAGDARRCGACLSAPPPFEACHCAVDYGFPWDGLITVFKYEQRAELARALAARLYAALPAPERAWPDLVMPVPLAPERLAERGYNQAWELARRLASWTGRPASARWLTRRASAAAQAGLTRSARRRNLRHSFAVADAARVAGRKVALVDDVLTTGATAAEASRALLGAGAAAVRVWVLARTPAPQPTQA